MLRRPGASDDKVIVLSHFSNRFGSGTTYRHYGFGTVLTLYEGADPRTHPEAAGEWVRVDTDG